MNQVLIKPTKDSIVLALVHTDWHLLHLKWWSLCPSQACLISKMKPLQKRNLCSTVGFAIVVYVIWASSCICTLSKHCRVQDWIFKIFSPCKEIFCRGLPQSTLWGWNNFWRSILNSMKLCFLMIHSMIVETVWFPRGWELELKILMKFCLVGIF